MKFENVNALYCDPNAYIKRQPPKESKPKKIVFQEPYECLPPFHLNNNFKKHDGNYGYKEKPHKEICKQEESCDCEKKPAPNFFGFDLKNILPLISGLLGSDKSGGIGNILSALNANESKSGGLDFGKLVSAFMSNGNGLNLLNLFNKKTPKKDVKLKSTDFQINEYTRVE